MDLVSNKSPYCAALRYSLPGNTPITLDAVWIKKLRYFGPRTFSAHVHKVALIAIWVVPESARCFRMKPTHT
jgi:hypothetical protein